MRNEDELCHYGVKGMKWGVRKDQKTTSKGRVNGTFVDKNVKKGKTFINNNYHLLDMSIQQADQFAMQEATRASINACLQAASLSASGGMDPFMFGIM